MKTITHNNREYKVIEMESVTVFPNIAALNPEIEYTFIAEGKRGGLISGHITKSGSVVVY